MDDVYIIKNGSDRLNVNLSTNEKVKLLLKRDEYEIMHQTILAKATAWICPSEEEDMVEFFYVIKGSAELSLSGESTFVSAGDAFYTNNIKSDVLLKTFEDTELLYVANKPVFHIVYSYQNNLSELLYEINEKDNITYKHSKNVMRISVRLLEEYKDKISQISMDDMVTAALFHDVGKCFIPDEILKKSSQLTANEYTQMKHHPLDSYNILKERFDEKIAKIALYHHERLDGSGYPYGITAEDMTFEMRVLAIADAFEAMTVDRGYNIKKGYKEAADELCGLSEKFDYNICIVLANLIENGEIENLLI